MSEWEEIPLGDLVDLFDHERVPLSSKQRSVRPGPYPYYGAQGVIDHVDDFIFDGRFILIPEDGENLRSRKLPIAYFADGQFWVNNHAHIAKAKPGIAVDRFVQGALEATDIGPFVTGAAQPKLSQANLRQIRLRVPTIEQQVTIASILDAIDDLIENNRRRVDVLEEMARAIYREWFVHFRYAGHEDVPLIESGLGLIPEGWRAGAVDQLVTLRKETVDPSNVDPSTPAVGLEHIPRRQITLDDWGASSSLASRKATFLSGDVLFGKIRPYFHKVSVAPVDGICSTDAIVLRPDVDHWGQAVLSIASDDFVANAVQTSNGTKMPRADWKVIREFRVAIPPVAIARRFSETAGALLGHARSLMFQARSMAALRDLLLPKLVTGQIDVSHLDLDALTEAATA
jgi:type I restriction enzyme S subunit